MKKCKTVKIISSICTISCILFVFAGPPKFTESSVKIVSSPSLNITLPVKSYTKEFINCSLTSVTSEGNGIITPNCTLTGHPPDLTLSFHLNNEDSKLQGIWMLTLVNKKGPANITLNFTSESGMGFKHESENPGIRIWKLYVLYICTPDPSPFWKAGWVPNSSSDKCSKP